MPSSDLANARPPSPKGEGIYLHFEQQIPVAGHGPVVLTHQHLQLINGAPEFLHPVKAVVVTFITVIGVGLVALLFMIVYGLFNQLVNFVVQFAKELSYLV